MMDSLGCLIWHLWFVSTGDGGTIQVTICDIGHTSRSFSTGFWQTPCDQQSYFLVNDLRGINISFSNFYSNLSWYGRHCASFEPRNPNSVLVDSPEFD